MSLDVLDRQAVACYDNSSVFVLIYHSALHGAQPLVIVIVSVPSMFTYVMIPHYRLGPGTGLHPATQMLLKPYKYRCILFLLYCSHNRIRVRGKSVVNLHR